MVLRTLSLLILAFSFLLLGWMSFPSPVAKAGEDTAGKEKSATPADGGTAEGDSHFKLTFPDFEMDGGEMEWRGRCRQIPDLFAPADPSALPWSLEVGGRISALLLPLSDRLEPMTSDRGLDSFQDVTYLIGGHAYLTYKQTLQAGLYFDTGFQKIDDNVNGQRREAEFNIFRVGTDLKVKKPVPWIMEHGVLFPEAGGRAVPRFVRNTFVGFGLESGAGGISLAMDGDDLTYNKKSAYIPVYYLTPKVLLSFRAFEYSHVEFYAGYYLSSFNDLTTEFTIDDKRMLKGADFNAFITGVQLNFGPGTVELPGDREQK
ncbi:MAG: hypothetical protein R6V10_03130 [bacterium]